MGKIVDFTRAHEVKRHERKEAKLTAMRRAFRAARKSWATEDGAVLKGEGSGLFARNKKKKKKNNNNKNKKK